MLVGRSVGRSVCPSVGPSVGPSLFTKHATYGDRPCLNLLFISLVLDDDDNDGVSNRVIFGGILDLLER